MNGKDVVKELAKRFRELTTKMQKDSQNKSKVIKHFSQIIKSTKENIKTQERI